MSKQIFHTPPVGSKAPDFSLKTKTAEGIKTVTLSEHFGKTQTVLLFVPLAFTGVCTQELCTISEGFEKYNSLNAHVYGISVDSPFALEAWSKASKMGITLLSDMRAVAITAYGLADTTTIDFGTVARRSAFVVDQKGIITYSWVANEQKDLPPFKEIEDALKTNHKTASNHS